MRTIGVVTSSRADYGIYLSILREIQNAPELRLWLFVTGMHLSPEFGMTVKTIEQDGFEIIERVEMLLSSDSPEGTAKSMGLGTIGFAQAYARSRPDLLLVLGDRFEMHAAVTAALPLKIPVAHIHGGEITEGAIDDSLRHSITKMSHLHFVAIEEYARRVRQLGEEPWRVTVCGAPALDNLRKMTFLTREEIAQRFNVRMEEGFLLVTYHPVTLEYEHTKEQVSNLLAALEASARPVLFTMTNADTHGRLINQLIRKYVETHPQAQMVDNLGSKGYLSVMSMAAAVVGNSSSGIIEAASLKTPVVNIGTRQKGRITPTNVISVGYQEAEISRGIAKAVSREFRESLNDLVNPYGDGNAAERIIERLRNVSLDDSLIKKRFCDLQLAGGIN
ncbi:MAG: UDP-N-acetylglucosamine 2-epimerase [Thermoguttaceae bacterium]